MLRNRYMGLVAPRQWTALDDYLLYVSPTVKLWRWLDRSFDARVQRLEDERKAEEGKKP